MNTPNTDDVGPTIFWLELRKLAQRRKKYLNRSLSSLVFIYFSTSYSFWCAHKLFREKGDFALAPSLCMTIIHFAVSGDVTVSARHSTLSQTVFSEKQQQQQSLSLSHTHTNSHRCRTANGRIWSVCNMQMIPKRRDHFSFTVEYAKSKTNDYKVNRSTNSGHVRIGNCHCVHSVSESAVCECVCSSVCVLDTIRLGLRLGLRTNFFHAHKPHTRSSRRSMRHNSHCETQLKSVVYMWWPFRVFFRDERPPILIINFSENRKKCVTKLSSHRWLHTMPFSRRLSVVKFIYCWPGESTARWGI